MSNCRSFLVVICVFAGSLAKGEEGAAPAPALATVLQQIGEKLAAGRSTSCSFVEHTTVEELDSSKKVIAREVHTFRVEKSRGEEKRTAHTVKKELGELNSKLRPKEDSELTNEERARRRNFRTAFHLEEQAKYRFKWAQPPQTGTGSIGFEPLHPDVERSMGIASTDLGSGQSLSIVSKPSQFPPILSQMDMRMDYKDTACGLQVNRIEMTGEGGFLFIRMRFHMVTVLESHLVID